MNRVAIALVVVGDFQLGDIQWGNAAAWVSAAVTFTAVLVALWNASDRKARRRAEKSQAEKITAWLGPAGSVKLHAVDYDLNLTVANGSEQLATRVIASLVNAPRGPGASDADKERMDFRTFIGEVPPGRTMTTIEEMDGMHFRGAIELAFQDAGGRYWVRKADQKLYRIKKDPADYYDLPEPLPWESTPIQREPR